MALFFHRLCDLKGRKQCYGPRSKGSWIQQKVELAQELFPAVASQVPPGRSQRRQFLPSLVYSQHLAVDYPCTRGSTGLQLCGGEGRWQL